MCSPRPVVQNLSASPHRDLRAYLRAWPRSDFNSRPAPSLTRPPLSPSASLHRRPATPQRLPRSCFSTHSASTPTRPPPPRQLLLAGQKRDVPRYSPFHRALEPPPTLAAFRGHRRQVRPPLGPMSAPTTARVATFGSHVGTYNNPCGHLWAPCRHLQQPVWPPMGPMSAPTTTRVATYEPHVGTYSSPCWHL